MIHFGWDYEDTETPHYQIFPTSSAAEKLMGEESILLFCKQTRENSRRIWDLATILEKMAAVIELWDADYS